MGSLTLPIRRRAWPGRTTLRHAHALAGEAEVACLLATELSQVLLVSRQYEFAGWEPSAWDYHGTGKGQSCSVMALYCTKEGIVLNLPGFSLSNSQPDRVFCWLPVPHFRVLSTSVLWFTGGSALECLFTSSS